MDKKFIGERITNLRMKKDISERELSLSLGKAHNYIYSISSGKILPTMESFLDICDYFEISPSDFFDEQTENPFLTRDILKKLNTLSEKNLSLLLEIMEAAEPNFMKSFLWIDSAQAMNSKKEALLWNKIKSKTYLLQFQKN